MWRAMTIKYVIAINILFTPCCAFAADMLVILQNFTTFVGLYLSAIVAFFLLMANFLVTFLIYKSIKIIIAVKNA